MPSLARVETARRRGATAVTPIVRRPAHRESGSTRLRWLAARWATLLLAAVAIGVHPAPVAGASAADTPGSVVDLSVRDGLLTADVRGAPLGTVLRAIAARAAIRVTIDGVTDDRVTAAFARVPLDEGLRRLVGAHSLVLVYDASPAGSARPRVAEIKVYGRAVDRPVAVFPAEAPPDVPESSGSEPRTGAVESRLDAIWAMGRPGDAAAAAGLTGLLGEDTDFVARVWAVRALRRVGGRPALEGLTWALGDPHRGVRLEAVSAYRVVAGAAAVPALRGVSTHDPDPEVRRHAVQTLARLGTPEALEAVALAAFDPSEPVRRAVEAASRAPRRR